jgi:hypothetical protein
MRMTLPPWRGIGSHRNVSFLGCQALLSEDESTAAAEVIR